MYGLVESIFVIYNSPYNAGNERVLKHFSRCTVSLCAGGEKIQTVKAPVYRETHIDLNVSISFLHIVMIIITITTINVLKAVFKKEDNVKYVQKYGKTHGNVLYLKVLIFAP